LFAGHNVVSVWLRWNLDVPGQPCATGYFQSDVDTSGTFARLPCMSSDLKGREDGRLRASLELTKL